jgi:hypothetical protein
MAYQTRDQQSLQERTGSQPAPAGTLKQSSSALTFNEHSDQQTREMAESLHLNPIPLPGTLSHSKSEHVLNSHSSSPESQGRIRSLLDYLDEVESQAMTEPISPVSSYRTVDMASLRRSETATSTEHQPQLSGAVPRPQKSVSPRQHSRRAVATTATTTTPPTTRSGSGKKQKSTTQSRATSSSTRHGSVRSKQTELAHISERKENNNNNSRASGANNEPSTEYDAQFQKTSPGSSVTSSVAQSVFDTIKSKMISLKVQLEDKTRSVKLLNTALQQQRQKLREAEHSHAAELKTKLRTKERESEDTIRRHQGFIDQLLADKESLTTEAHNLAQKLSNVEENFLKTVNDLKDKHLRELRRAKESWSQQEKRRRESWMSEKTKSIKKMTIKGLEPEIQQLIAQHKTDVQRREADFKAEIRRQQEQLLEERQRKIAQIRDEMSKEKDSAVLREQEAASRRFREQIDSYEQNMQKQRIRFEAELRREREQVSVDKDAIKSAHVSELARLADEMHQLKARHEQEAQQHSEEWQRRLENAVTNARSKWQIEREQWQQQMISKLNKQLADKERKMRGALQVERDEQLKHVVDKLANEQGVFKDHARQEYKQALKTIKQQHAEQLAAARAAAADAKSNYTELLKTHSDLKTDFSQLQLNHDRAIADASSSAQRIEELQQQLRETEKRMQLSQDQATQELQLEVNDLKGSAKQYQLKLEQQVHDRAQALQEMEAKHNQALDDLHGRVRSAIQQKDAAIRELRQQIVSKQRRIEETERLLQQQRAELLGVVDT